MKGFAVSLIIAAVAIGSGSSDDRLINEPPRYLLELKNNEGANVGKLEYHVDGDYSAFIYGALPGLEPGTYYAVSYEDTNFNGTCASSDPFETIINSTWRQRLRDAFIPVNLTAPFYSVRSYVQGLYLGCDTENQPNGLLTYVYLVPKGAVPRHYVSPQNAARPSPAACGYIKMRAPCHD